MLEAEVMTLVPQEHQPMLITDHSHFQGISDESFNVNEIVFVFCFLGLHPQHVEVPRLGAE